MECACIALRSQGRTKAPLVQRTSLPYGIHYIHAVEFHCISTLHTCSETPLHMTCSGVWLREHLHCMYMQCKFAACSVVSLHVLCNETTLHACNETPLHMTCSGVSLRESCSELTLHVRSVSSLHAVLFRCMSYATKQHCMHATKHHCI